MSKRSRRPGLEELLDRISALRDDPDAPATVEALRTNLAASQNLLVARAARVAGDLGKEELVSEMLAAFDRLMADPVETDKGCHGKTEIAKALVAMEQAADGLFLSGLRHVQMEGAFGGPIDVAIELRANCAIGLANSGHPNTVLELVPLLLDPGLPARLAAAQGIAASGQVAAEAVLRFKVLAGDEEPEVLTECLAGLLRIAPERSLAFVKPLLGPARPRRRAPGGEADGNAVREAAILALGESRLEEAVPLLIAQWERSFDRESRRLVLLALVASRREPAVDFLVSLVAEADPTAARQAISALAVHRGDPKVRERVAAAVERSESRGELRRHFAEEFG
jgi:HEAT repeat protein